MLPKWSVNFSSLFITIFLLCSLQWRHNGRDSVSNHQPHDCLLNRLFRRRSKKTSKLRVTGLCAGNSPVNSPHKWPVMRKRFPFDGVIMFQVDSAMKGVDLLTGFALITHLLTLRATNSNGLESSCHYSDVIMDAMASQITSLTVDYTIVYSDADERKHQNSASLAFVWGIHRWPVNSPHKWPITRKMFSFDYIIMLKLIV